MLEFGVFGIVINELIVDVILDDINYEGVICGMFDWVGDFFKLMKNIFCVIGVGVVMINVIVMLSNLFEGINGFMMLM